MSNAVLRIGFVPLLDCASVVAAAEKGFAAAEGLKVRLVRESSWANIRDRLIVGHFDAAHMLGPMTIASSLGVGQLSVPMIAPLALGVGGNAITVSTGLWRAMQDHGAYSGAGPTIQGAALRAVVAQRSREGAPALTLAMVYPFSSHNYLLRYWLAACGVDPDEDVQLIVNPPPFMVDALRSGQVDGFCAGEPWNSLAVADDVGCIVAGTTQIWRRSPEKVLGLRADWAESHAAELRALIRAIYQAALWCEQPQNHPELASILAQAQYVGAPVELLERTLARRLILEPGAAPKDMPDFLAFNAHAATVPCAHHALWFYSQMVRWRQISASPRHAAVARAAYRPDLYYGALRSLGVSPTAMDEEAREGSVPDFFDGVVLDPARA